MRFTLLALLLLVQDPVKKVVPDADKTKSVPRKISKESREKIEKALGEKLDDKDLSPSLYECYSLVFKANATEKTKCTVCVLSVKGPKGNIKLGVAAATSEKVLHAVKILENGDDKEIESKLFLSQFQGIEYTSNLYSAPGVLTGVIEQSAAGKDDASKTTGALIRMCVLMRGVGPIYERMVERIEKRDAAAAEDIGPIDKSLEDAVALLPNAGFLKQPSRDRFKEYAAAARADLAPIKSLIAAGKFEEAGRKAGELESSRCAKCHGSYRRNFWDRRLENNLGDGYFSTKLDVVVPDREREALYQLVATGVRKAVLLAAEAK